MFVPTVLTMGELIQLLDDCICKLIHFRSIYSEIMFSMCYIVCLFCCCFFSVLSFNSFCIVVKCNSIYARLVHWDLWQKRHDFTTIYGASVTELNASRLWWFTVIKNFNAVKKKNKMINNFSRNSFSNSFD